MKKVIASAGLLALGAMGSQTAMAQWTAASDKPWSVSATLRGFYDDNINTSPDKVSSSGFEIDPSISYNKNMGPTTITVGYSYSYRYYMERVDNHADQGHDFNFFLQHDFNERYSLAVEDHFLISQEPEFSANGFSSTGAAVTFPLRSNGDNISNTGAIRLHAQLTRLMGFMLSYQNTIYNYDENASNTLTPTQPSRSALLDRMEQRVTLENTWVLTELTTGIIGYAFGTVDYNSNESINSPTAFGGVPTTFIPSSSRNNYSHFFYVGAEHQFRQDLHGSARVGIQYQDYYNVDKLPPPYTSPSDNLSPYIDLNVGYTYADGGLLSVGFQQVMNQTDQAVSALNPTAGVTQAQESSVFYGSISKKLTPISPSLTGSLTGQFQHSVYVGGPADGEADNFYVFGVNLSYQFDRYFSADIGYNYDLLDSDLSGRGYDRNRVYVGVTGVY
jgi:hypothetical protein